VVSSARRPSEGHETRADLIFVMCDFNIGQSARRQSCFQTIDVCFSHFETFTTSLVLVPTDNGLSHQSSMFLADRVNIDPVPTKHHRNPQTHCKQQIISRALFFILFTFLQPSTAAALSLLTPLYKKMGQAISTSQWYVYGKRHFTQTGYLRHIKQYTEPVQASNTIRVGQTGEDGVNLGGKVVVVTG